MSEIHEVVLVDVNGPDLLDLRATALRPVGDKAWHIFLSPGESDLWLCLLDCQEVLPLHFDVKAGLLYAKLAHLLGESWDDCWADPHDVLHQQRELLTHMDGRLRRKLDMTSIDEIARWRRELEPLAVAEARGIEILREVVGVEPEAAFN